MCIIIVLVLDMIVNLERELEEERLKNVRLLEKLNHCEKKRKRRVSQPQQQRYHSCDNGLPLSPTMESEPAKCSYQVPTAAASRGIKVHMYIYCIDYNT